MRMTSSLLTLPRFIPAAKYYLERNIAGMDDRLSPI
jgi:hypothetical protein